MGNQMVSKMELACTSFRQLSVYLMCSSAFLGFYSSKDFEEMSNSSVGNMNRIFAHCHWLNQNLRDSNMCFFSSLCRMQLM